MEQKSNIKTALKKKRYRQGEKIVKQGEESGEFYIVEDGVCEVSDRFIRICNICRSLIDPPAQVSVTVKDTETGEIVHRCVVIYT